MVPPTSRPLPSSSSSSSSPSSAASSPWKKSDLTQEWGWDATYQYPWISGLHLLPLNHSPPATPVTPSISSPPMATLKKAAYQSLYLNPLTDIAGDPSDKENESPNVAASASAEARKPLAPLSRSHLNRTAQKPRSLQLCMRLEEPDRPLPAAPKPSSSDVWDFSDTEAAPASSWSTLPNRSLLCRPLPLDVGRCTCIIAKETAPGMGGISLYSLYTNEGQGRQDRKLAVARHRRRNGRSEFNIAQNPKGIFSCSDDSFLGTITANLIGSKYSIWDQGTRQSSSKSHSRRLLGVIAFVPTLTTCTGSFRSMRAWIPKHQSMLLKSTNATTQIRHVNGLPQHWEEKRNNALQLFSKVPYYNCISKRYELNFRENAGKMVPKIRSSVKNFQLTMEENGRQSVLQLGKIARSKYVMEYRYPSTGYQAFCICLASMDSKLCCSM